MMRINKLWYYVMLLALPLMTMAQDLSDDFIETYRSYEKAYAANDVERAATLAARAWEMAVNELGKSHEKVAILRINLGHVLLMSGKLEEAEQHLLQAKEILVYKHGNNFDALITVHEDLAIIYANTGRMPEARQGLEQAIAVVIANHGDNDLKLVSLLASRAQVDVNESRIDDAANHLIRATRIIEQHYGINDPRAVPMIVSLGDIALTKQDYQDAEKLYQQSLKIYQDKLAADDPRVLGMHAKLAEFYISRDNDKYSLHADKVISLARSEDGDAKPLFVNKPDLVTANNPEASAGWVLLEFTVTAEGRISNAKVLESRPQGVHNQSVLKALQKWRFMPKTAEGKRVAQPHTRVRLVYQDGKVEVHFGEMENSG